MTTIGDEIGWYSIVVLMNSKCQRHFCADLYKYNNALNVKKI